MDDTYRWDDAKPAIRLLRTLGFPVILSSSKTLEEMTDLAAALDTQAPIIAENGALVAVPMGGAFATEDFGTEQIASYKVEIGGLSRSRIVALAHQLRDAEGYRFEGFHDWTADQLCEATGLSTAQATQAMNRQATEPIRWRDTEARWQSFSSALRAESISTVKGGRFIHLMGATDKAVGLRRVVQLYKTHHPDVDWHVVALGDSPNDVEMLSAADTAVVIPNPRHPMGIVPVAPKVIQASKPGPAGWNATMLRILEAYQHTE